MSYSLIIPIYNEIRTLPKLLKQLEILNQKVEIIIIDDGSNDGSDILLSNINQYKVLQNKNNLGKGASILRGVNSATKKTIILIDGDLEINIDAVPKLITKFENNKNDAVVGIRWRKKDTVRFEINSIGNYLINNLFNLLYRSTLNDVLCCMKILDKKLFKSLKIQSTGFSIEVETMAKLILSNSIIEEIYIDYHRRTPKEGKKLKISDGWNIVWTMIKLKYRY